MTIKISFVILFFINSLIAENLDKKIELSQKELTKKEQEFKYANRSLAIRIAKIRAQRKKLKAIDIKLKEIEQKTRKSIQEYERLSEKYREMGINFKTIEAKKLNLETKLTKLITNQLIFLSYITKNEIATKKDLIDEEITKVILAQSKTQIEKLTQEFEETALKKEKLFNNLVVLDKQLQKLKKAKELFEKAKDDRKKIIQELINEKRLYRKKLTKLKKESQELRKTLNKYLLKQNKRVTQTENDNIKIKNYGSSYMKSKIIKYSGKKYKSPLIGAKVTKRFGEYQDPIYGIKVFNESIELVPNGKNFKVRNVLNGRVVLIKKTPYLGNVLIIKHKGDMHTIYAHLDKISPTLKQGVFIKSGYILGSVIDRLTFEVTKRNAHINPLDLIKL